MLALKSASDQETAVEEQVSLMLVVKQPSAAQLAPVELL
jgi:hypothetical protein